MKITSTDYHDYVFRDGRLIGEFDAMYQNSREVPWHQDALAHAVFSNIDITILKNCRPRSVCDVGCGLGHFTSRCRRELLDAEGQPPSVTGIDISETAIQKASRQYTDVEFVQGDMLGVRPPIDARFDVVIAKDVLWYVCQNLDRFLANMVNLACRAVYVAQSFPETENWVGQNVIDGPESLFDAIGRHATILHTCVERDFGRSGRPYVHVLAVRKNVSIARL